MEATPGGGRDLRRVWAKSFLCARVASVILSPTHAAGSAPAIPWSEPRADRQVGGSRESQACRAGTSSCPPGRRCPGSGLRLAVDRDLDWTEAVPTARLTCRALLIAGWRCRVGLLVAGRLAPVSPLCSGEIRNSVHYARTKT